MTRTQDRHWWQQIVGIGRVCWHLGIRIGMLIVSIWMVQVLGKVEGSSEFTPDPLLAIMPGLRALIDGMASVLQAPVVMYGTIGMIVFGGIILLVEMLRADSPLK